MAQQNINYGALANDGTGDGVRTAFIKTQNNFSELYEFFYNSALPISFVSEMLALTTVVPGDSIYVRETNSVYLIAAANTYDIGPTVLAMTGIVGQAVNTSADLHISVKDDTRTIEFLRTIYGTTGTVTLSYDGVIVDVDLAQLASFDITTPGGVKGTIRRTLLPFKTTAAMIASAKLLVGDIVEAAGETYHIVAASSYTTGPTVLNLTGISGQAVATSLDVQCTSAEDTRTIAFFQSIYGTAGIISPTYDGSLYDLDLSQSAAFQVTTAGGVELTILKNASGDVGLNSWAVPAAGLTQDNSQQVQNALDNFSSTTIDRSIRLDTMIEIPQNKTLHIKAGAQLTRTTDTANTDPTVWLKSNSAMITGEGTSSLIRSFNASPKGVVRFGHKDYTESHSDVLYSGIKDIAIYGRQQYGVTSGDPDICLYMANPQIGGKAVYFNYLSNILMAHANIGLKMQGNINANTIHGLQFLRLGGNDVGVENGAIYFDGAKENMISQFFVHFSPNVRCIYVCQDSGVAHELNFVVNWVVEPGASGTAQGLVIKKIDVGNRYEGTNNGVGNDFGVAPDGFFGNNKRNSWSGINEQITGMTQTIRRPSPGLTFDGTDVGGGKSTLFGLGTPVTPIMTFRANGTGGDDTMWEMVGGANFRPANDNLRDIGQSTRQVRNLYLGTSVRVNNVKVLGTQGAAVPNAVGGDEVATINLILAALRAHGLIAT